MAGIHFASPFLLLVRLIPNTAILDLSAIVIFLKEDCPALLFNDYKARWQKR